MSFRKTGEAISQVPDKIQAPKPCLLCSKVHSGSCAAPTTPQVKGDAHVPANRE